MNRKRSDSKSWINIVKKHKMIVWKRKQKLKGVAWGWGGQMFLINFIYAVAKKTKPQNFCFSNTNRKSPQVCDL